MNRERRCLATAIYFEAREGPVQRQIGVGQVILNRVRSPQFPQTICGVVYQGQMAPNCEFPFACDGRSDIPEENNQWWQTEKLSYQITAGQLWLPELGDSTSLEDALAIGDPALLAKRHPEQYPPSPEPPKVETVVSGTGFIINDRGDIRIGERSLAAMEVRIPGVSVPMT